jgi:hypothetical protein
MRRVDFGDRDHHPLHRCTPEQMHGSDQSTASDVWELMCIFAELYASVKLFSGPDPIGCMVKMLNVIVAELRFRCGATFCDADDASNQRQYMTEQANLHIFTSALRQDNKKWDEKMPTRNLYQGYHVFASPSRGFSGQTSQLWHAPSSSLGVWN